MTSFCREELVFFVNYFPLWVIYRKSERASGHFSGESGTTEFFQALISSGTEYFMTKNICFCFSTPDSHLINTLDGCEMNSTKIFFRLRDIFGRQFAWLPWLDDSTSPKMEGVNFGTGERREPWFQTTSMHILFLFYI